MESISLRGLLYVLLIAYSFGEPPKAVSDLAVTCRTGSCKVTWNSAAAATVSQAVLHIIQLIMFRNVVQGYTIQWRPKGGEDPGAPKTAPQNAWDGPGTAYLTDNTTINPFERVEVGGGVKSFEAKFLMYHTDYEFKVIVFGKCC